MLQKKIGKNGFNYIYNFADILHCLPIDQAEDEIIEMYHVILGSFSPETGKSKIPSELAIGKVYARLVEDVEPDKAKYPEALEKIWISKIPDFINNYDSAFYYSSREFVKMAYLEQV